MDSNVKLFQCFQAFQSWFKLLFKANKMNKRFALGSLFNHKKLVTRRDKI